MARSFASSIARPMMFRCERAFRVVGEHYGAGLAHESDESVEGPSLDVTRQIVRGLPVGAHEPVGCRR